jgi:ABC-type bacteriocin/lantibiotic exporter with double-glycine peptidase domain
MVIVSEMTLGSLMSFIGLLEYFMQPIDYFYLI